MFDQRNNDYQCLTVTVPLVATCRPLASNTSEIADVGDLAVFWNNREGRGEIRTDGADLAQGDPLETAILVSLFTDARAEIDELPPGIRGQRGWWGSTLEPEPDNIGSKLWLLDRSKQTNDVPVRAEEYARAALGWIVTDGPGQLNPGRSRMVRGWLSRNVDRRTIRIRRNRVSI